MEASSSLGLLGKLPREIRDEIYFKVSLRLNNASPSHSAKRKRVLGHVCINGYGILVDMEKRKPLSIFAVSLQISQEASQSLSSRTTLHFDGDAEFSCSKTYTKVANISVTLDAMLGLVFEDEEEERFERGDERRRQEEAEEAESGREIYWAGTNLLDRFTSASTAREAAHLHFRPIGTDHATFFRFEEHPPLICSQELRHSIKNLVSFRKVVMVLEFVVKAGDACLEAYGGCDRVSDDTMRSYVQMMAELSNVENFTNEDEDRFKKLTTDVGKDFETYLGPFNMHFVDRANGDFAGIITYHPRKVPDTITRDAAMAEEKFPQMLKAMTESSIG